MSPRLPPLDIPNVEQWFDHFDEPEDFTLNLGAETPQSVSDGLRLRTLKADRDCGICSEFAIFPLRTLCCGTIYCSEHITQWLRKPSSDGRCPSCDAPCSVVSSPHDTYSPSSPITTTDTSYSSDSFSPSPKEHPLDHWFTPLRLLTHSRSASSSSPLLPATPVTSPTTEVLSRLASIIALTLLFYVLLAS